MRARARDTVAGFDLLALPNADTDQQAARQTLRPSRFRERCIMPEYAAKVGTFRA